MLANGCELGIIIRCSVVVWFHVLQCPIRLHTLLLPLVMTIDDSYWIIPADLGEMLEGVFFFFLFIFYTVPSELGVCTVTSPVRVNDFEENQKH